MSAVTMLRSTVLPRRLTQLFADNKKSYEALVQPRRSGPELSHLHLKLRIQKDRLIAWGIQWSDRSTATQTGDIDQSLDKAGISDLVASIMCSIRELLDEAESLQPMGATAEPAEDWTGNNIRRLEEILKDLTTSIDTLCDLSRSKVEGSEKSLSATAKSNEENTVTRRTAPGSSRQIQVKRASIREENPPPLPPRRDDLTDLAYIDPSFVRQKTSQSRASTSPPSYESVATGSENRVVAYFSPPSSREASSGALIQRKETPVLLDYRQTSPGRPRGTAHPDKSRFEELLLGLLKFPTSRSSVYTGIMKLTGWTSDVAKSRCAFVYEIPTPEGEADSVVENLQPRSLLSFLQNGGDADSNNIPSLENRLKLAHNVALSILHLHEINVTHGNLNSNNLLFFLQRHALATQYRIWKTSIIRKPYLTGFHQSGGTPSSPDYHTSFTGYYQHPMLSNEQGSSYQLAHDYYSLGLILLEIGLWMPIGKFWKSRYSLWDFKARLQDIYMKKLSAKCGDGYMNAVLYCVTAAEVIGSLYPFEQSSSFRQNVIIPLSRCCGMDKDIEPVMISHTPEQSSTVPAVDQDIKENDVEKPLPSASAADRSSTATLVPANISTEIAGAIKEQPKIRVWSHELPALYLTYWTTTMFPKLERILRKALNRMESYTIDLFMAGREPDTARPTIYMECTSTSKCQRILRHLNKELRLFEIKVVCGQIVRSKGSKLAKKKRKSVKGKADKKTAEGSWEQDPNAENLNPHYQEQPLCGASIGAYLNGSHLPPVTFGGAVLVDGQPYGMSVHHMLEDEEGIEVGLEDRIDLQRSMAPHGSGMKSSAATVQDLSDRFGQLYPYEVSEPPEVEDTSSIGYPCSSSPSEGFSASPASQALYPFEIPDDDFALDETLNEDDVENDFWLNPSFDASATELDEEESYELGDTDGISPGQDTCTSLAVTQPALDDVHDGFFPSPEDADSEHLTSHSFGHIHASSGLRRSRGPGSLIHEIDWALIKIHPERLPHCLRSDCSTLVSTQTLREASPLSILPSNHLASRPVHSHTRSSGLFARGTILPSMRLVRMPGRVSPSHSWQVRGSFGGGGDSGAWVFDDATGNVCGHVLAYSDKSSVAYIAPMDVMIEDMGRVLGGKVGLPGALPLPEGANGIVVVGETRETMEVTDVRDEKGKSKLPLVHAPPPPAPSTPSLDSKSDLPEHPSSRSPTATLKHNWKPVTASPAIPTSPPMLTDYPFTKPVDGSNSRKASPVDKNMNKDKKGGKAMDGMSVGLGAGRGVAARV
ncbi:hypothetical protein MMC10_000294 [Thelotrema lepadinum]|nr:hypothetical protein [Thelotrema lepadinum]